MFQKSNSITYQWVVVCCTAVLSRFAKIYNIEVSPSVPTSTIFKEPSVNLKYDVFEHEI